MNEITARELISNIEDEHTERKAARGQYDIKNVCRYTVALSNEGGGHLILGVDDAGNIVGSQSFQDISTSQNRRT